jgi:hypothetical protein
MAPPVARRNGRVGFVAAQAERTPTRAGRRIGRTLPVLESLLGQLYLVTIVAVLVNQLGSRAKQSM